MIVAADKLERLMSSVAGSGQASWQGAAEMGQPSGWK